ncbi:hypothetical protein C8J57DRAFT_1468495 [Mycena rebaudengoi]|nr:hypothetical protein C8J57DRAFT_1468495 [Mycena rebaudengoi]
MRKVVAELLGLNGKVTARSIAYVAVLVCVATADATFWTHDYYGVSLPQLYDFIVDFFEAPGPGTDARARADDLLKWWNQQIFPTHASSAASHRTAVASRAALRQQRAAAAREARETIEA